MANIKYTQTKRRKTRMSTFAQITQALSDRMFVTRKKWDDMYIFFGMDNMPNLIQKISNKKFISSYVLSIDDLTSDDWIVTEFQWDGSQDNFLPFEEKNTFIDVSECKWDTQTGAIRTNDGCWLMPSQSEFQVLNEESKEEFEEDFEKEDDEYISLQDFLKQWKEMILNNENAYHVHDQIVHELRTIACRYNMPLLTATQNTRSLENIIKDLSNDAQENLFNESNNNERLISEYDLPIEVLDLFMEYFNTDFLEKHVQFTKTKCENDVYRARIFSPESVYIIRIHPERNYMGCVKDCRKARAGESWTRGSDYPDGEICDEIMHEIMNKIFQNVFEPISESVRKV